jgi:hypothetical protein
LALPTKTIHNLRNYCDFSKKNYKNLCLVRLTGKMTKKQMSGKNGRDSSKIGRYPPVFEAMA